MWFWSRRARADAPADIPQENAGIVTEPRSGALRDPVFVDRAYNAPLPRTYWIEVSAKCNLKCPFCPTANGLYYNDARMMSFGDYQLLFEKIKHHALFIYFHRHGEPTLNKDLFKIIRHTADHGGIYTLFSTNLNTLRYTDAKADEVVRSGISEIIASIDGASQETYSKYRRGGSFAFAMEGLASLARAKERLQSQTPKLNWQFLINRYNEHEVEVARLMAAEMGVDIYFLLMEVCNNDNWLSSYHREPAKLAALTASMPSGSPGKGEEILEAARRQSIPDGMIAHVDNISIHDHFPWWCSQVFHTMSINTDGTVSPCTEIADSRFNLGNLMNNSLEGLWNGERFRQSRRYILNKEVNRSICERCVRGESACSPS